MPFKHHFVHCHPTVLFLPFLQGDECPVLYRVDWSYSREQLLNNGDWELRQLSGFAGYVGPLSFLGIFVVESSQGSPCGTANRRISYRIQAGNGQVFNLWSDDEFNCGPFTGWKEKHTARFNKCE